MSARSLSYLRVVSHWGRARFHGIGLLLLLLSCASEAPPGPLVRLRLSGLMSTVARVTLQAVAKDAAGQSTTRMTEFTSGPYDLLGITFPLGTKVDATFQVDTYDAAGCVLGSGSGLLTIDNDGTFELPIALSPPPLPCGAPAARLTVEIGNGEGGAGLVTSSSGGINCGGTATSCSKVFMRGEQVTLQPQATLGSFFGWVGGGCTGLGSCTLTLGQDTKVQALFGFCRGWCKEGNGLTMSELHSVWGLSASHVVAVGASGTLLRWNGSVWATEVSAAGNVALRSVTVPRTTSTFIAVGDNGTIVSKDAVTWSKLPAVSGTPNLYGVAGAQSSQVFIVGTGGTYLKGGVMTGFSAPTGAPSTTLRLTAISDRPASDDNIVVGFSGFNIRRALILSADVIGDQTAGVTADLHGVWHGPDNIFAVGAAATLVTRSVVNGSTWSAMSSPVLGITQQGIWGSAENNIYAVGASGTLLSWDGVAWKKVQLSGMTNSLNGVWGASANNIYVVGDKGLILHYLP